MKIVLLGLLTTSSSLLSLTLAQETECTTPCTVEGIKTCAQAAGITSPSDTEIESLCEAAALPFLDIAKKDYQHDKNYMDGGTDLNRDKSAVVAMNPLLGPLWNARSYTHSIRVQWPYYDALRPYITTLEDKTQMPYMSNFNLTESCQLRTAMCCFTETREDGSMTKNAKPCTHNLRDSRRSSHINRGYAFMDDKQAESAYCVGFSWDATPGTVSYDYKANLLSEISYGSLLDLGATTNIPMGAPMCGCIEKMPTVTKAACKEAVLEEPEKYKLTHDSTATPQYTLVQTGGKIKVQDCAKKDLLEDYTGTDAEKTALSKHLIASGDCTATTESFMNERVFVKGADPLFDDDQDPVLLNHNWIKVAGQGKDYVPHKFGQKAARNAEFMKLFKAAPHPIVFRKCHSCLPTHQYAFYVRKTPVPEGMDFLDLFLNDWTDTDNVFHTDFEIYSTYEEAVKASGGEWQYCNFDGNTGFPRDCGPEFRIGCQWNSHSRNNLCGTRFGAFTHAFYVLAAEQVLLPDS